MTASRPDRAVSLHAEVSAALDDGRPVVALETAVLTHGLPRTPLPLSCRDPHPVAADPAWHDDAPLNLETVRAMARAVRASGSIPAVVAVRNGAVRIGLDDGELETLAADRQAAKASIASLAAVLAAGAAAGTTVSATLLACSLVRERRPAGSTIRVFATGGIGGVHRGWTERPDVSADLIQLSRTAVCVVCAGAKSILDGPATLEALETLGVPVAGLGTDWLPRFHAAGGPELPAPLRVDDTAAAARLCERHWHGLGCSGAVVLAVPPPPAAALEQSEVDQAVMAAEAEAARRGMHGPDRTPYVLAELARRTDGRSLSANIALLIHNAAVAGKVARALAAGDEGSAGVS